MYTGWQLLSMDDTINNIHKIEGSNKWKLAQVRYSKKYCANGNFLCVHIYWFCCADKGFKVLCACWQLLWKVKFKRERISWRPWTFVSVLQTLLLKVYTCGHIIIRLNEGWQITVVAREIYTTHTVVSQIGEHFKKFRYLAGVMEEVIFVLWHLLKTCILSCW